MTDLIEKEEEIPTAAILALIRCAALWNDFGFPDAEDIELCIKHGLAFEGVADEQKADEMVCEWGTEVGNTYYELTQLGYCIIEKAKLQ